MTWQPVGYRTQRAAAQARSRCAACGLVIAKGDPVVVSVSGGGTVVATAHQHCPPPRHLRRVTS